MLLHRILYYCIKHYYAKGRLKIINLLNLEYVLSPDAVAEVTQFSPSVIRRQKYKSIMKKRSKYKQTTILSTRTAFLLRYMIILTSHL